MSLLSLQRLEQRGALAMPETCEGCKEEFKFGEWELHHGWARCANCGLAYCIVNYEDDENYNGPEMVASDEWKDAVADFYEEYGTQWHRTDHFKSWMEENHPELIDNGD